MEHINLFCRTGVVSKGYVHLKKHMKEFIGVVVIIVQLIPCCLVTVKPFIKSSLFCVWIAYGELDCLILRPEEEKLP